MEDAQNSICFVKTVLKDGMEIDTKAFCLGSRNNIVSYVGGLHEDAQRFLISFPWSRKKFEPLETNYHSETGVCTFRLPDLDQLQPLLMGRADNLKKSEKLYVPYYRFYDWIGNVMVGKIKKLKPADHLVLVDHEVCYRDYGAPVLNLNGAVVGIIASRNGLTKKDKHEWNLIKKLHKDNTIDEDKY